MNLKKRRIEIVDYDRRWPDLFQEEARLLSEVLSTELVRIHHIGSTAVAGLKAKSVIDILLEVKDVNALDAYDSAMKKIGYIPKGEFGIPGRRFYLKGPDRRTCHVHAFTAGSHDVRRHIAFRDYLMAHPLVAGEYGALKARCASECNDDIDRYCDGKRDFVAFHETRALEWTQHQGQER